MTKLLPFLKDLLSAPGLSGYETPVARLIEDAWRDLTDETTQSKVGSLHALKRGEGDAPRPSLMIATHMDAIGLMATEVVEGFIRVTEIGGIDPRVLPGQAVTVHGTRDLPGVIVQPPAHLLPDDAEGGAPLPLEYLLVDVGLPPRRVARLVPAGSPISFATEPVSLQGETLTGHSLDNRASVAALTLCLQELQKQRHAWDVWAVATAQEEETLGGALTSAFALTPDIAIALDVTFAKGPGVSGWETFPLGEGITLGWGPNIHPALHRRFKEIADELEIPYEVEPTPWHSGTDAMALQIAAEGIPTMVIGIPIRYMHTPVEVASLKDIRRAGRLLAAFIARLETDFLENIVWDD